MSDKSDIKPVLLSKKGALTATAKAELRKAGYRIVEIQDLSEVQELSLQSFKHSSEQAKASTFERAINYSGTLYRSDLMAWYIERLKQLNAF